MIDGKWKKAARERENTVPRAYKGSNHEKRWKLLNAEKGGGLEGLLH